MVECEFPECTTFGSVIRFALELEKGAAAVCEELAKEAQLAGAAETFNALAAAHKKRSALLEYTRREKLNEMIQEPIQDLDNRKYIPELRTPKGADLKSSARFAAAVEDKSAMFYGDMSKMAKNLLSEAARIMDKMAKENLANKAKLEAL
jgi:hypothetical protein